MDMVHDPGVDVGGQWRDKRVLSVLNDHLRFEITKFATD